jgi:hypothetical protein
VLVQFRQQTDAVPLHDGCRLDSLLVVCKAFLGVQPSHPDVYARLFGVAIRVGGSNCAEFASCRVQQHNLDIMMMLRLPSVVPQN